jgi:hypothetical protein
MHLGRDCGRLRSMLCRLQGTDTTRPFGLRPEHQGLFVLAYFSFVCCFSRRLGAQLAPKPLPPVIAQTLQACLRHHWMVHLSECTCLCCEGCSWVSEGGRQVRQTARCLAALQRLVLLGALPRHTQHRDLLQGQRSLSKCNLVVGIQV